MLVFLLDSKSSRAQCLPEYISGFAGIQAAVVQTDALYGESTAAVLLIVHLHTLLLQLQQLTVLQPHHLRVRVT